VKQGVKHQNRLVCESQAAIDEFVFVFVVREAGGFDGLPPWLSSSASGFRFW
jgi:hypothetical protein